MVSKQLKSCFDADYWNDANIQERREKIDRLNRRYPGKIPIIFKTTNAQIKINPEKFLVPNVCTMLYLNDIIRKRIKLQPHESLYFFINNSILSTSQLIMSVYSEYKSEDSILYIYYSLENTFG